MSLAMADHQKDDGDLSDPTDMLDEGCEVAGKQKC